MTKKCTQCNQVKDVWRFSFRNKKKNTRRANCKECHKLLTKAHYQQNKADYKARSRDRREKGKQLLLKMRDIPCMDCKGTFLPIQMDFDHRPGEEKVANVTWLMNALYIKQALAEAQKCDIICANCHRLRTWNRIQEKDQAGIPYPPHKYMG